MRMPSSACVTLEDATGRLTLVSVDQLTVIVNVARYVSTDADIGAVRSTSAFVGAVIGSMQMKSPVSAASGPAERSARAGNRGRRRSRACAACRRSRSAGHDRARSGRRRCADQSVSRRGVGVVLPVGISWLSSTWRSHGGSRKRHCARGVPGSVRNGCQPNDTGTARRPAGITVVATVSVAGASRVSTRADAGTGSRE